MKSRSGETIKLTSIDELLGVVNEESAMEIEINRIHAFKNHPFKVLDDEKMADLIESVKSNGVLTPVLLRSDGEDGYEMISGHRRMHAAAIAGLETIPAIVRELSDDDAVIAMVDANIQREELLPNEKGFAYKMKLEAVKHQGERSDLTSPQVGQKSSWAVNQVAADAGESKSQIQRYIRLTELVPDLQKMVDEKKLAFTPAVEISFIRPKNQRYIAVSIEGQQSSPSLSQAQKMRELDKDGKLNGDVIDGILSQEKKEVDKVIINSAELEKYFGKDKSPREMKDKIISLLDDWKAKQPPELGKPEKKTDLEK